MSDFVTISRHMTGQQATTAETILASADLSTPRARRKVIQDIWEMMIDIAPRPATTGLTKLQRLTLEAICDLIDNNEEAPTLEEIGAKMHLTKDRVCKLVNALHQHKYIHRRKGQARGIQVINRP